MSIYYIFTFLCYLSLMTKAYAAESEEMNDDVLYANVLVEYDEITREIFVNEHSYQLCAAFSNYEFSAFAPLIINGDNQISLLEIGSAHNAYFAFNAVANFNCKATVIDLLNSTQMKEFVQEFDDKNIILRQPKSFLRTLKRLNTKFDAAIIHTRSLNISNFGLVFDLCKTIANKIIIVVPKSIDTTMGNLAFSKRPIFSVILTNQYLMVFE